jgi:2-oxoglutarate ferredoxin oxidoreductase subunit delta
MKFFDNGMKTPSGEIHIIEDRCKGCGFCVTYCPVNVLELLDRFNERGYHPPYVKNPEACINCGLCEMICPEFAIWSTLKEEREASEVLSHRLSAAIA